MTRRLREVQYAQRVWGDSAALQATTAWIRNRQGLGLRAQERFNAVRGAITIDATRLSAVPGGRRGGPSAGRAADHLPARLLAAHSEVLPDARSRSVSDHGAHGAGVHVHGGDPLVGERARADAADAEHRPHLRAQARHEVVLDRIAVAAGDQRAARHAVLQGSGRSIRRRALRARRL